MERAPITGLKGKRGERNMQKEIIKLLQKISRQLEEIALVQDTINVEIRDLYADLVEFRSHTLKNLEEQLAKGKPLTTRDFDNLLN